MGREASTIRKYLKAAKQQGFIVEIQGSNGHYRVVHPEGMYTTASPHAGSDVALKAFRSRLRRLGVRGL